MNLDNTYNKLQTLGEYVDDTEDYVRFEIDTQRNRFIEVSACFSSNVQQLVHCFIAPHIPPRCICDMLRGM